jgi:hypothetical protein
MKPDATDSRDAKGERWPLVVAVCIALPLTALFAYGLARGTEEHEVRPALGLFIIATVCVPIIMIGVVSVLRWWHQRRVENASRADSGHGHDQDVWQRPSIDDHLDSWFDPSQPGGHRKPDPPPEYSLGPGFSRLRQYRKPIPKPTRRI